MSLAGFGVSAILYWWVEAYDSRKKKVTKDIHARSSGIADEVAASAVAGY